MEQAFEQRYLVDIKSEAHQKALDYKLSYLEGIVYNSIAYSNEHFGECILGKLPDYLHITHEQLIEATSSLSKKGLITIIDGTANIKKWTLEELREDPLINNMIDCFIELMRQKGADI